jgi:hypothetical protein
MQFLAYPLRGVNDIEFGMSAEMVGERMTGELEIGDIRAKSKDHPTHFYPGEPVFFYFDADGHLEGVEFCEGADVRLGSINLLELPVREAIAVMKKLDADTVVDDQGAVSHRLSFGIWCPNIDDEQDEEPVETVLIARQGYYDYLS